MRPPSREMLKEKFWWIDVIYPIALALILLASLTWTIYADKRQRRVSLAAESFLLEASLYLGMLEQVSPNKDALIVNIDFQDINRYKLDHFKIPDVSFRSYSDLLTKLANAGIKYIFVDWDVAAFDQDDQGYALLENALRRLPVDTKVSFAVRPSMDSGLPESLRKLVNIVENTSCGNFSMSTQVFCTFNKKWDFWSVQNILNILRKESGEIEEHPGWVSNSFASNFPTYILNLNNPEFLPQFSMSQILDEDSDLTKYKYAFVGKKMDGFYSDITGDRSVKTIFNISKGGETIGLTPNHLFWAQISDMYLNKRLVFVPPAYIIIIKTAFFCLLILVVINYIGGPAALGIFILYVITSPYLNALSIKYLKSYLPLFDSLYFGLLTFVLASFGKLSYSAFQRWRLTEAQRYHAYTADLKGNFISLLSHNLNTPVAKMQGTIAILNQELPDRYSEDFFRITSSVAQLEYAIRAVLIATALEEKSLNEAPKNIRMLYDDFLSTHEQGLKRLGINLKHYGPTADDESYLFLPMRFDVRVVVFSVAALAALFRRDDHVVSLEMSWNLDIKESADSNGFPDERLSVSFESEDGLPPEAILALLRANAPVSVRKMEGEDFLKEILAGLVLQALKAYRGQISIYEEGPGGVITLVLCEEAQV